MSTTDNDRVEDDASSTGDNFDWDDWSEDEYPQLANMSPMDVDSALVSLKILTM